MQCKMCKKKINKEDVKVKNGYICKDCYDSLPESVKACSSDFTTKQLLQLMKIIKPAESKVLVKSGMLKICAESIAIKNTEYLLRDLRKISLNFHPAGVGSHPNTVVGTITIILETKSPHFMIEEPFFENEVTVGYGISGKVIYYYYSYEIEKLFELVQECIDSGTCNMIPYIKKYQKLMMKEEEYKRQQEEIERKKREEAKRREEEKRRKREESQKSKSSGTSKTLSPFEEAKSMFCVEMPYTKEQIKKSRNNLIKRYHPDNKGGSEEMCRKINENYALLLKFASS